MIKNGFNDYSELIESCREKFETYYKLLTEYNGKFNITAITEKSEVYSKHFEDSLLGAVFIDKGTLIDVGSGGGFPAIPLKIVNDDLNVTLLDATEKKCLFMETVVRELGLKNV
ncbi:MAG: 16S rRNA (guanine(527)-N(7))-methyltransferase RsmG, partial [Clostridia bacterium]|nr:16S rRNA (guanine(527)-N(7))-methyltransferase RsmG [Clostridia bacterium]